MGGALTHHGTPFPHETRRDLFVTFRFPTASPRGAPLRDNKNAPSARCIARHALGRGRTPCHHLTVALSNFEPSLIHHSFPRRMCCAKRRFMASRRFDDYGQYLVRPKKYDFVDQKFTSPSYDEMGEVDGEETTFTASDSASWTIVLPSQKRHAVEWHAGDYVYITGLSDVDRDILKAPGPRGRFAEIGKIINFYDDPANEIETIWLKYLPAWRQEFVPAHADISGDDFEPFIEREILLTKEEQYVRIKWIEMQKISVIDIAEDYIPAPHTYLLRYEFDPGTNRVSKLYAPAPEEAMAEDPAGGEAEDAAAGEPANEAAPVAADADGERANGEHVDGEPRADGAAGAAGAAAPPKRRNAKAEHDKLKAVVLRQEQQLGSLHSQITEMQRRFDAQADQLARLLQLVGMRTDLLDRVASLETGVEQLPDMQREMRKLSAAVEALEKEM